MLIARRAAETGAEFNVYCGGRIDVLELDLSPQAEYVTGAPMNTTPGSPGDVVTAQARRSPRSPSGR